MIGEGLGLGLGRGYLSVRARVLGGERLHIGRRKEADLTMQIHALQALMMRRGQADNHHPRVKQTATILESSRQQAHLCPAIVAFNQEVKYLSAIDG